MSSLNLSTRNLCALIESEDIEGAWKRLAYKALDTGDTVRLA
jgi:hypothetical protein